MKKKALLIISAGIFLSSLLWRGEEVYAQSVITVDSIIQTSPCAGSNIYIPYSVSGGNFNFGNVFTAQLSSPGGSFSNPTNIGSIPYWNDGMIVGAIPISTTFGFNYKVRIVASSPSYTSSEAPNSVIITTIAQLATVTVSPYSGTFCNGDSAQLSVVTPVQDYLWSTGATTQSIYVLQTGAYTVTITDWLGCKTTSDPTEVTVQECTGVQNISSSDVLSIYPNPFSEATTLEMTDWTIGMKDLEIILVDILGKEVFKSEIKNRKTEINRGNLPSGIFFYKISAQEGIIQTGKVIVQ